MTTSDTQRDDSVDGDVVECFYQLSLELWTSDDWDAAFSKALEFLRARIGAGRCALYLQLPGHQEPHLICSGEFSSRERDRLARHHAQQHTAEPRGHIENFQAFSIPLQTGRPSYLMLPAASGRTWEAAGIEPYIRELARVLTAFSTVLRIRRQDLYEERAAISRELHDSLAQSLTYLKIQVSRLEASLRDHASQSDGADHAPDRIARELRMRLNRAYRELRELMTTFRLTMHGRSFNVAVEDLIKEYEQYSSIAFTLDNRLEEDCLSVDEEMQVLQIVREALSNIVQHSRARHTDIHLNTTQREVHLTISDDGIGPDKVQMRDQHHGLLIMQERAFTLNGEFNVTRSDYSGTVIDVRFRPSTYDARPFESPHADTFV